MTDAMLTGGDRQRIRLYFVDLRKRFALGALFLGLVLAELAFGKLLLLAGLAWLAGALVLEARRPSENELDDLVFRDLLPLVQRARQRLTRTENEIRAAPLVLWGPEDSAAAPGGRSIVRVRTDREGRRRSPVIRVVILLPMEDQLGLHSCRHELLTGVSSLISSEEHHYRDIETLSLEEDVKLSTAAGGESVASRRSTQILSLVLTSGKRITVPAMFAGQIQSDQSQMTNLEKTLLAIRALMRDKR